MGSFTCVCVQVISQQVCQAKTLVAEVALVRFVAGVGQHVPLQLILVTVAFATLCATEWLLLVKSLMGLHVLEECKIFSTVRAFVWLLPCVDNEVLLQVAAESKGLATLIATVWLVLTVNAHMQLQHRAVAKTSATVSALQRFLVYLVTIDTTSWHLSPSHAQAPYIPPHE